MMDSTNQLKEFFESSPLYEFIELKEAKYYQLREIQLNCNNCETSKPFHNQISNNLIISINAPSNICMSEFKCVTCGGDPRRFWVRLDFAESEMIRVYKIGQYPRMELQKSKALSSFFKSDKEEYNKAVICLSHGYGVAAFTYMRRIVESNINNLLDMIEEDEMADQEIKDALKKLKDATPMSNKIAIANKALPEYLLVEGHNLLGTMYKVLSEGVHSLSDKECLEKAKAVQRCLEYIISGLATHKKNKDAVRKDVELLKSL